MNDSFQITHFNQIEPVDCPCGKTRRAFADDPDQIASAHLVDVNNTAKTHYHKKLTEIYYVVEGQGHMELDGRQFPLSPGSVVLIKPGCRHRAVGNLRILNIPVPSFDPEDEWFD